MTAANTTPPNTLSTEQTVAALKDGRTTPFSVWIKVTTAQANLAEPWQRIPAGRGVGGLYTVRYGYSTADGNFCVGFMTGASAFYPNGRVLLPAQ